MHAHDLKMVTAIVKEAAKAGFKAVAVDTGEATERVDDLAQVLYHVGSVDDSHIHFRHETTKRKAWALIVLGNSPGETLCDYTCTPGFEEAMENVFVDTFVKEIAG